MNKTWSLFVIYGKTDYDIFATDLQRLTSDDFKLNSCIVN